MPPKRHWSRSSSLTRRPGQLNAPRAAVAQFIEQRFGIRLRVRTRSQYLARWGFTPQKPMKKADEQPPAEFKRWRNESYTLITARAKDKGAETTGGDKTVLRSNDVRSAISRRKARRPWWVLTTSARCAEASSAVR